MTPDQGGAVLRVSWPQACARRLERQALSAPAGGPEATPAGIAAAVCGVHAQVLSAAELSIGLRLEGGTRGAIRDALWAEHSLIKTYGPRGTLHLLAAADLPLWTGALPAVPSPRGVSQAENELLAPGQAALLIEAIGEILAGGELTLDELTEGLVRRVGSWAGDRVMDAFQDRWPRWRIIQGAAGMSGALCFGPNRGRQVTYTHPRRWLPGFRPAEPAAALAELVRRYLGTYGPATPQQFARWLAAPPAWAAALFESLRDGLQAVEMEGTQAWLPAGDTGVPAALPQGVRLLPYFDAYVVGSYPRERLFPGLAAERALTRGQAGNRAVLLVDGIVAGIWHQRRSGRHLDLTVEAFSPLSPAARRDLDEQVARTGEILEATPRLTLGPVTAGPHA